jgi:hypothetical protein
VAAVAEQYVAAWGKLGQIQAGQEFYPDSDEEEDEDEEEDRYRTRKYLNMVSLTTPPATDAASPDQPSNQSQAPKGFDLVVKRVELVDGDDWFDPAEVTVLSTKRYPV